MVVIGVGDVGFFLCVDVGVGDAVVVVVVVVVVGTAEEARMMLLLRLGKMRLAGMLLFVVSEVVVVGVCNANCGTPVAVSAEKAEVVAEEEEGAELA